MKNWQEVIQHKTFRYIDHTKLETFQGAPYTALTSFAIDDALATSVSEHESPPAMRLWVHPETIVLGISDGRTPYLEEGIRLLKEENYHVVIRNSGGLAVALDEGVLNLSLVLPDVKHLSIHDCYEAMTSFIQYMLQDLTNEIEAYEIVGSYCPGDYDLSINGKKFAGISQRRVKNGAAIQIYLDVEGNSRKRAELVRRFYERSIQAEETRFVYPNIDPSVMASLSELLKQKLTVEDMKTRVQRTLEELNEEIIITEDFSVNELETFDKRLELMVKRNQPVIDLL